MGLNIDRIWQMIGNKKESNKPTHAKAVVLRRDNDGTIWVKIEGGVDETPVYSTTADVKPNDVVTVKVSGGKVYIEGSTSAPSVGVTEFGDAVSEVRRRARDADEKAQEAKNDSTLALLAAKEAASVTKATSQHFWVNEDEPETYGGAGAHVTEQTKDEWEEAIRRRFPDLSDEKPYHNILMNSLGILLRTALNNLVSITRSSVSFFDGQGNNADNVVASFGKEGAQIGYESDSHVLIDYHSLKLVDKNGNVYLHVNDLRDESGLADITAEFRGDGTTTLFMLDPLPSRSHIDSMTVTVSDSSGGVVTKHDNSVIFSTPPSAGATITVEYVTDSQNVKSYTFGNRTGTTGFMSFVEGTENEASGKASHAEGDSNNAVGEYSHAEGDRNNALGVSSHAEGSNNYAQGACSHAEGSGCIADGDDSHAQNQGTYAGHPFQTAIGSYNDNKAEDIFEVGNGTIVERSNALELTSVGRLTLADDVIGKSGGVTHKLSEKLDASELDPVKEKTDKLEIANNSIVYFTISAGSGNAKLQIMYNSTSKNLAVRGFDGSSWTNVSVIATLS